MKISRPFAVLGATVLALAAPFAASAAVAADEPIVVSIVVEMDLPYSSSSDGPIVFQVTDVTVGDGPELTEADLVANPSEWCGSLDVDVDAVTKTISIYTGPESQVCDFQTVSITLTSDQIGPITLIEDSLFDGEESSPSPEPSPTITFTAEPSPDPSLESGDADLNAEFSAVVDNGTWTFDYTSVDGVVQLDWAVNEDDSLDTDGITILGFGDYEAPVLAATGSDSPALFIGVGAGVLLLGLAAFAVTNVTRRERTN